MLPASTGAKKRITAVWGWGAILRTSLNRAGSLRELIGRKAALGQFAGAACWSASIDAWPC